jgi:hypothetical protein
MCQRRQNSMILVALYGESKLAGIRIPTILDSPTAMSEYAEKSKYSWSPNASAAPHASRVPGA